MADCQNYDSSAALAHSDDFDCAGGGGVDDDNTWERKWWCGQIVPLVITFADSFHSRRAAHGVEVEGGGGHITHHQTFSDYLDFLSGRGPGGVGQTVSAVGTFTESFDRRRGAGWEGQRIIAHHQTFSDYLDFLLGRGKGGVGQIVAAV